LLAHVGEDGAGGVEEAEDVCVEAVVGFFWAGEICQVRFLLLLRKEGSGHGVFHLPCLLDRPFENVSRGVDEDVEAAYAGV
jgi:hypothetical protein